MLIDRNFEKRATAIIYFATYTRYCTRNKLMFLLHLLDFEHYRQTGRSVTEELYCALSFGPVPSELYRALHRPDSARSPIEVLFQVKTGDATAIVIPQKSVDYECLTPRQLHILAKLSERYREDRDELLQEAVCVKDGPWDKIYHANSPGKGASIPYELALDGSPHRTALLQTAHEREMYLTSLFQASN